MTPYERRMYRQEVEELTTLLRTDPKWEELRRVLRRRRVRPPETLLAAFMEDGKGMEYGVLVTGEGKVIEYHRRIGLPRRQQQVLRWQDWTADPAALQEYPQLSVALEMYRRKERAHVRRLR
jgi:hypothetical protein